MKTLRIHAVKLAVECSDTELGQVYKDQIFYVPKVCAVAALACHGMDPRVCAASLRSLLRPRMTKVMRAFPLFHVKRIVCHP